MDGGSKGPKREPIGVGVWGRGGQGIVFLCLTNVWTNKHTFIFSSDLCVFQRFHLRVLWWLAVWWGGGGGDLCEKVDAAEGENAETPLFKAVERGDFTMVLLLLQANADPNWRSRSGMTVSEICRPSFENLTNLQYLVYPIIPKSPSNPYLPLLILSNPGNSSNLEIFIYPYVP